MGEEEDAIDVEEATDVDHDREGSDMAANGEEASRRKPEDALLQIKRAFACAGEEATELGGTASTVQGGEGDA